MYWNFKCKIMNLVGIFLNAVDREKYQALHPLDHFTQVYIGFYIYLVLRQVSRKYYFRHFIYIRFLIFFFLLSSSFMILYHQVDI